MELEGEGRSVSVVSRDLQVGAVLCGQKDIARVKRCFNDHGWLKEKGKKVVPYQGSYAIFVSETAAIILNLNNEQVPPPIRTLLDDRTIQWKNGVRLSNVVQGPNPPAVCIKEGRFTFSELFAGIGGFRLGLEAIGGRMAFASEIDKKAQSTYYANFKDEGCGLSGDITEIDGSFIPGHDLLTAGFPCQSFSKAGPAKGFSDPRGTLFREITRVLRDCQPKALILENVSALVTHENGTTFDIILSEIVSAGYIVNYRILNTSWVTPQHRERVYIIGFRSDFAETVYSSFEWPIFPIVPRAVKDILEDPCVGLSEGEDKYGLTEKQWETIQKMETNVNRRMAKLDGKARTLMSHYKKSCYMYSEFVPRDNGLRPRFYTPRECARLQGFPEDFILTSCGPDPNRIYYQLGNTVCPIIISALAVKVLKVLEIHQGKTQQITPDKKGMDAVMSLLLSSSPNPQAALPNGQSLQQIVNLFLTSDPSINTTNGEGPNQWRSSNKSMQI